MNLVVLVFNIRELRRRKVRTHIHHWFIGLIILGILLSVGYFCLFWLYTPATATLMQNSISPSIFWSWRLRGLIASVTLWLLWVYGLSLISIKKCAKYRTLT